MKYLFFLPASIVLFIAACNKETDNTDEESGNWVKRSEFEGKARTEAVSFVIGDTAYLGTGFDGKDRYQDFWAYDPTNNFWVQRARFPGKPRNSAAAFAIDGKGYIACGYDGLDRLSDHWEYNPKTNIWTQKADFAGSARTDASAFAINGKGYITCGYDGGHTKDLWEFDPLNNTWIQRVSMGGSKRSAATVFVYNNMAYLVTGSNNGTNVNDFWKYNPSDGKWTELRKITNVSDDEFDDEYSDIIRNNAVGFVLGNKAYLTVGLNGGYTNKTWEYDFASDEWVRKTPFERSAREGAVAFSVKGKAFVATGLNSSFYWDDLEEFLPLIEKDSDD